MLVLVAYSCFTTVYFVAILNNHLTELTLQIIDYVIEGFFWLDLIFNFMLEYRDPDTYKSVRKHKMIAKKYIFRGWFFVDFVSVFPFYALFPEGGQLMKLFRLFRLPKLVKLIDISKFNQLLKSFFENSSRDE